MTRAIARGLLLLVLLVALTAVWLGSHLDRLVKDELVRYGTEVLQVPVSVGAVTIRLLDGQGQIRNLVIGSPRGFKAPHALQVDRIEVAIDIGSVMGDVVVIRQIAVVAPNLIYEMGERRTNLEAIRANVDQHAGKPAPAPAAKPRQGKKLIVEEFSLRGARAEASIGPIAGKTISVSLPDITLRDIGKAKGGATPDEVGQTIVQAITRELAAVISFDRLGRSAGDRLDKAAKAIKDLFK